MKDSNRSKDVDFEEDDCEGEIRFHKSPRIPTGSFISSSIYFNQNQQHKHARKIKEPKIKLELACVEHVLLIEFSILILSIG